MVLNNCCVIGKWEDFSWHVWMHLVLGVSICMGVLVNPYRNEYDMKVELFALLCLAVITHVASLFEAGEDFSVVYLVLVFVMTAVPIVVLFLLKAISAKKAKDEGTIAAMMNTEDGKLDANLDASKTLTPVALARVNVGMKKPFTVVLPEKNAEDAGIPILSGDVNVTDEEEPTMVFRLHKILVQW